MNKLTFKQWVRVNVMHNWPICVHQSQTITSKWSAHTNHQTMGSSVAAALFKAKFLFSQLYSPTSIYHWLQATFVHNWLICVHQSQTITSKWSAHTNHQTMGSSVVAALFKTKSLFSQLYFPTSIYQWLQATFVHNWLICVHQSQTITSKWSAHTNHQTIGSSVAAALFISAAKGGLK